MRRIRDFMPATLSVGVRPTEGIVAATSGDVVWLLPRDPRDPVAGLLPRPAQVSFSHQGHLVVLHGQADRAAKGTVAFTAAREGRVDNFRGSSRLDVQLPVRVSGPAPTRETTTINISAGGVFLGGGFFGPRGATLDLELRMPTGELLAARGDVVRILPTGTGVRFTDIDAAARASIDAMVLDVRAALARRFADKAARDHAAGAR